LSIDSLLHQVSYKVQHTLDAANNLVHLAQTPDGRYNMLEVNAVTLLQLAVSQIQAQATAKDIRLELNRAMDNLFEHTWVWGDAGMLTRAFMNLLTNTVRYSDSGSGVFVSLSVDTSTSQVHCVIRDEGIGMSEEQIAGLNQTLMGQTATQQSHSSQRTTGAASSLGVGLHMVSTVIRDHNGIVVFTDAKTQGVAQGTIVRVTLPALPPEDES
jgi:signal transduction histidine kinase